MRFKQLYIVLLLFPCTLLAQEMNNTAAYRDVGTDKYLRINYDNDFFTATDEYYTQGINIAFVHPWLKHFPLSHVLIPLRAADTKYGLAIEHNGYTPRSIGETHIQYNNHPYAGVLLLRSFAISNDPLHRQRLSSSLSAGVIGPAAWADGMQKAIHKALNNIQPGGWQYQVQNDLALNYSLTYEHQLFNAGKVLELVANTNVDAGTLLDKLGLGACIKAGYFNSPFSDNNDHKALHAYLYDAPAINGVAYDATLQGGMFNRSSPYTINEKDISRLVFSNRLGIVLCYKAIYLEYYQAYRSKTFKTGLTHQWGGISLGIGL